MYKEITPSEQSKYRQLQRFLGDHIVLTLCYMVFLSVGCPWQRRWPARDFFPASPSLYTLCLVYIHLFSLNIYVAFYSTCPLQGYLSDGMGCPYHSFLLLLRQAYTMLCFASIHLPLLIFMCNCIPCSITHFINWYE